MKFTVHYLHDTGADFVSRARSTRNKWVKGLPWGLRFKVAQHETKANSSKD